jgi:hypothetical protein
VGGLSEPTREDVGVDDERTGEERWGIRLKNILISKVRRAFDFYFLAQ